MSDELKLALTKADERALNIIEIAFADSLYTVDNGCLCVVVSPTERLQLLNGVVQAVAEVVKDDGAELERKIMLLFRHENGKKIPAEIPVKALFNGDFVHEFGLDFRPSVGNAKIKLIADSILAQAAFAERRTIYQQTGWRKIEGEWIFLHNDGAIGASDITTELPGRAEQYRLPAPTDPARFDALNQFLKVAPAGVVYPLLGTAFLSPLCEAFRRAGLEPAFAVWLQGVTGSRKSTLAALTMNFFGAGWNNKTLPASFKDSANYLEKLGFALADVPVAIDDFHPSTNRAEASKMDATAQAIARCWGDRVGRNRMSSDLSLRRGYPARGMAICTGEDSPAVGQSGAARFFTVELKSGDVDLEVLSDLQQNTWLLAEIMSDFVDWLRPQYEELPVRLKTRFLELRNKAQSGGHGRTAEAVADLQIGLEMMADFLKERGILTEAECEIFLDDSWQVLVELSESQARKLADEKPTKLFIDALRELLATGAVCVADLRGQHPDDNHTNPIGFRDDSFLYLLPDSTYRAVRQFYNQADRHFPLTSKQLYKQLAAEGLIYPDATQSTRAKRISGKLFRCLWLKASALEVTDSDGDELDEMI